MSRRRKAIESDVGKYCWFRTSEDKQWVKGRIKDFAHGEFSCSRVLGSVFRCRPELVEVLDG